MIPALIAPILSQPELLQRMLLSLDHPVGDLIVIDNGDVVRSEELHKPTPMLVIDLPHNIGVAASWNLGIKVTPLAPWWLIVNHDIEFGPGDLDRMAAAVDVGTAGLWLFSDALGLAGFAITRHTLNAVGWFDEGVGHPAYNEDLDFVRRVELAGLPRYETGWSGTHVGSATISDPHYKRLNDITHGLNDRRYVAKWGGAKAGGETFTTPFNRGGHLGDWRLDIELLRAHAWPRRE